MTKKYPKSESEEISHLSNEEAYVTWGEDLESKQNALKTASESLSEFNPIERTTARRTRLDFSNLDSNVSGRPGLTRMDYDAFRPEEAVPTKIKAIIKHADRIYQKVGLVKNVIDLMGDFACQGIRIVHQNKRIERFYKAWFKKVSGKDRSERFLNNLYRTGNIVINRQTAKLNKKAIDKMYKVTAKDFDIKDIDDDIDLSRKEVPWRYTFIDPVYVDVLGGSLSSFVSKKIYGVTLPSNLRKIINSPKNDSESKIVDQLPSDIIEAAKTRKPYVLNSEKTVVFHYKKDDWQIWAYPMIYAIMDDITVIEKLKLADMCALDGAVSNIRIFKLGNLDHKIAPTKAAASKLSSILGNNVGGGTMDLVWGPDIELIESNSNVHNFLGEEKYKPHLNSIYAGLGIPPTLTGTFGAAGTTNNFISLKTLTQRLQYGRDVLISFWKKEIELVQKTMGFKYAAKIEFDRIDLSNEDAEKALLIQLADRNIISDELLQMKFGVDPNMEKSRLNRENRDRDADRMVKKSGPFHDGNFDNNLRKIALQLGIATPSQVGLDLEPNKPGQKTAIEMKAAVGPSNNPNSSPTGVPGQGRPRNTKDSQQRKTKDFAPQTGASLSIWANQTQDKISDIVNPLMLEFYNKNNLRKLSANESKELDSFKTKILFNISPNDNIDDVSVSKAINNINSNETSVLLDNVNKLISSITYELNRALTIDEIKHIKSFVYSKTYS